MCARISPHILEAHPSLLTIYYCLFLITGSLDDHGLQNWTKDDKDYLVLNHTGVGVVVGREFYKVAVDCTF